MLQFPKLQFAKTKVSLYQIDVILTDYRLSYLDPVCYLLQETFKLFGIPIFWLWAYLFEDIPETCHV